jgi:carbonic anhydrase
MKINSYPKAGALNGSVKFISLAIIVVGALALFVIHCAPAPDSASPISKAEQSALTPEQALERLKTGNARFVKGQPNYRNWRQQRAQTAEGQYPFAVVLSCIDSRAGSEIIFDQGLGDIFNARVAGNILDEEILGSMEFACKIAGAKLIAVVGHSHCGAVKGACSGAQLGHLTGLLDLIKPSVAEAKVELPGLAPTDEKLVGRVAELNVQNVLKQIPKQSPVLRELIDAGKVGLVGGIYDLDSGKVQFFNH